MNFRLPAGASSGPTLRDIHLPPAPAWWPPAPGWWMLAGALLIALLLLGRLSYRRRQRAGRRRQLLAEMDSLAQRYGNDEPGALASALHQLLRRAARVLDPEAVSQRGDAWRATLAKLPVPEQAVGLLMQLDSVIYRPAAHFDREQTLAAARQWLGALAASDAMARPRRRQGEGA